MTNDILDLFDYVARGIDMNIVFSDCDERVYGNSMTGPGIASRIDAVSVEGDDKSFRFARLLLSPC